LKRTGLHGLRGSLRNIREVLNGVTYDNYYFYLSSKKLFAMIYYDMEKEEPILYIVDSARHYLKRNTKVSKINREFYLKFFNYVHKLVNLDYNQRNKIENLKYELLKERNVSSKEWLLTRIELLQKLSAKPRKQK
jgi:hypothetical protein